MVFEEDMIIARAWQCTTVSIRANSTQILPPKCRVVSLSGGKWRIPFARAYSKLMKVSDFAKLLDTDALQVQDSVC